ncbi:MAG TPA: hypothetical protein VEL76_36190 [Gemmataceae bacterium]|nr:hypothetical protein [Gemmataceae bacterium]
MRAKAGQDPFDTDRRLTRLPKHETEEVTVTEKAEAARVQLPESNAQHIARCLVYNTVDLDGSGVVHVLALLQARAAQVRAMNLRLSDLDRRMASREIASQEEYNAELLEGLYETTCLKWFLASALRELAVRLESEVSGAQVCLNPIRQITFASDGQVESFLLDFPAIGPGGAYI